MAWELGAADAFGSSVLPCRALGLHARDLPLLQNRRQAPDLGDREELVGFLFDLAKKLEIDDTNVGSAVALFYQNRDDLSPFDARISHSLRVSVAGERVIIENRGDHVIHDLRFTQQDVSDTTDGPSKDSPSTLIQAEEILTILERTISLRPGERKLATIVLSKEQAADLAGLRIVARWRDPDRGRRRQILSVNIHEE